LEKKNVNRKKNVDKKKKKKKKKLQTVPVHGIGNEPEQGELKVGLPGENAAHLVQWIEHWRKPCPAEAVVSLDDEQHGQVDDPGRREWVLIKNLVDSIQRGWQGR
jgi:hypothetical protein